MRQTSPTGRVLLAGVLAALAAAACGGEAGGGDERGIDLVTGPSAAPAAPSDSGGSPAPNPNPGPNPPPPPPPDTGSGTAGGPLVDRDVMGEVRGRVHVVRLQQQDSLVAAPGVRVDVYRLNVDEARNALSGGRTLVGTVTTDASGAFRLASLYQAPYELDLVPPAGSSDRSLSGVRAAWSADGSASFMYALPLP